MQVPFALSLFCLKLRWSGLESTPTGYCSAWISPTLSVDRFDTQNLPAAVNRDPGASPFSVPTLGCGVTGLLFPELSCLRLDSLGVTCYCRDTWQNRTPQTACMGPMPMGLHILQFGRLLTLHVRFSRGPRVEQVGTLNDLCLKNESCRSKLNCEKEPWHGCCLGTVQDYSLKAIRMCTLSLKTHLSICSHLPCLSRAPDALQAAGQHLFHGSGCTLEEIVFCWYLRWDYCTRLLSDVSVACESFLLETSQDLKHHAFVNYLVWLLDRK